MTWALLVLALAAGAVVTWYLMVKREPDPSTTPRSAAYAGDVPGRDTAGDPGIDTRLDTDPYGFVGDLPSGELPPGYLPVGDVSAGAVEVGTGAYGWGARADEGFELDALAWDDGSAAAAEPLEGADAATWTVLGPASESPSESPTPSSTVPSTSSAEAGPEAGGQPSAESRSDTDEPPAVAPQPDPTAASEAASLAAPEPEPEAEPESESESEPGSGPGPGQATVTDPEPDGVDAEEDDDPSGFGGQPTAPPDHYLADVEGDRAATRWMADAVDEDAIIPPREKTSETDEA
ncbi:hypothetical protein N865_01905 [Intrasporangium oryzae NRRL B-24470]|uniref:Uncharacterized protein n=1 Tax=Intrasporangium oryzae NRRL B-24470 TaxID=1386089 RepID=W9GAL4_9MICO|nr:hypothetical protein [Intrasporangium oryzae]EWT03226.1 hypothetical protein N865_01905 [Intrasporangium oryzae NRRL B-24470]